MMETSFVNSLREGDILLWVINIAIQKQRFFDVFKGY